MNYVAKASLDWPVINHILCALIRLSLIGGKLQNPKQKFPFCLSYNFRGVHKTPLLINTPEIMLHFCSLNKQEAPWKEIKREISQKNKARLPARPENSTRFHLHFYERAEKLWKWKWGAVAGGHNKIQIKCKKLKHTQFGLHIKKSNWYALKILNTLYKSRSHINSSYFLPQCRQVELPGSWLPASEIYLHLAHVCEICFQKHLAIIDKNRQNLYEWMGNYIYYIYTRCLAVSYMSLHSCNWLGPGPRDVYAMWPCGFMGLLCFVFCISYLAALKWKTKWKSKLPEQRERVGGVSKHEKFNGIA